jgi:hypothetical protein
VTDDWQSLLLVALGTVGLAYVVLLLALLVARPRDVDLRQAARLIPDVARLVPRLARDRTLATRIRVRLWLLLAYLVSPSISSRTCFR